MSLDSLPAYPLDPAASFALLPISAMGLAAILARLRGPSRFAQLAADRHAYLSMLELWPMVEPSECYRMLEQLRVTHAEERLLQLVDLIAAAAIRLSTVVLEAISHLQSWIYLAIRQKSFAKG